MSVTGQLDTYPFHTTVAASRGSRADVVTFLLTDIEGSSLRWLHHRTAMQQALR